MRREAGGIHCHPQVHRQRGEDHDDQRRALGHQLHSGQLRGSGDHRHREPQRLQHVKTRIGGDDTEHQPKGADDQQERRTVAETLPVGAAGLGGGVHRGIIRICRSRDPAA